jgi:LysM repeat protein
VKPGRTQQALAGLGVFAVIMVTLLVGIIVTLAERVTPDALPTLTAVCPPTWCPTGVPVSPTRENTPTVTASPTHRPTRTATSAPTSTGTERPTATHLASLTPTLAFTPTPCQIADGWVPYDVQPGDTLFSIGWRYGVTVDTMMGQSCLASTFLHAGDVVHVPPVTPRPLPTSTGELTVTASATPDPALPTATETMVSETAIPPTPSLTLVPSAAPPIGLTAISTLTATDGACTNPDSRITSPRVGELLLGTIQIIGTARVANFASYRLELRQEGTGQPFAAFMTGDQPVKNGLLAEIDTRQWPNGEYWLRLVVVDAQGNYPERCSILIAFYNCDCISQQ